MRLWYFSSSVNSFFKRACHPLGLDINVLNEPTHETMVLFVLRKLIFQTCMPSTGARCLIFGWTLRLLPYFMCANNEGSGETAQIHLSLRWSPM